MYWSNLPGEMACAFVSRFRTNWVNQKDWRASWNVRAGFAGTFLQTWAILFSYALRRESFSFEAKRRASLA